MRLFLFLLFGSTLIVFAQNDSVASKRESQISTKTYSIDSIIAFSKTFLGLKYKYGGVKPTTGFDCSGFVKYVFNHFGYDINRTAREQYKKGLKISKDNLRMGDLIFFRYRNSKGKYYIAHVGMIIDIDSSKNSFDFIHSCRRGVTISSSNAQFYARRIHGFKRFIDTDTLMKNN